MHQDKRIAIEAGEQDSGGRVDRFLAARLPELSRTRIKQLIEEGRLTSNGTTIGNAKHRVKPGERFELDLPAPLPAEPEAESIPLNVLYEDADLVVLDKPPGLVVHPAAGNPAGTLVNALLAHCGDSLSGIGGVARPGIVHRLDKDTSGVMVAAKTDAAHRALAAQFADHGRTGILERRYLALVWGAPPRKSGTIDAAIGRHPTSRQRMAVLSPEKGREAITHYKVIETYGPEDAPIASLLECRLETGRTHQVRVHLAHIGHPVMGDPLYATGFKTKLSLLPEPARRAAAAFQRQALHAVHLGFAHPATKAALVFDSSLPPDLSSLIASFKEL
jgi:23S rRNA pseudouridine1911/1915/1917 synthase